MEIGEEGGQLTVCTPRRKKGGTYVRVVQDGAQDPVHHEEAREDLHFRPPGYHQRAADPRDLGPVERQDAHPEAARDTEELVDHDIVGDDPTDPVEVRHRLKDVVGEDITAISERLKNWDRRDMYNLTISRAMMRHCEGLRRLPLEEVDTYERMLKRDK